MLSSADERNKRIHRIEINIESNESKIEMKVGSESFDASEECEYAYVFRSK